MPLSTDKARNLCTRISTGTREKVEARSALDHIHREVGPSTRNPSSELVKVMPRPTRQAAKKLNSLIPILFLEDQIKQWGSDQSSEMEPRKTRDN